MSRLLKDCLQQHSTPGVLPYDQIESVTLVDAKWTQSVQTPNPVALKEFPGMISQINLASFTGSSATGKISRLII